MISTTGQALMWVALLGGGCQTKELPTSQKQQARPTVVKRATTRKPHWPPFPADTAAAEKLIASHTRRPLQEPPPAMTAAFLLSALAKAQHDRSLIAGWPAVIGHLRGRLAKATAEGRDSYLLAGTYHDSAGQLRAFDRLMAPGGVGPDQIVLELFDADGYWQTIGQELQRGDSKLLAAISNHRTPPFLALAQRQWENNYTAWKYGYLPVVQQLLLTARATGIKVRGCDMPRQLQRRLGLEIDDPRRMRLRELHCVLSLHHHGQTVTAPVQTLMLWGSAHVQPTGVGRFLPARALVIDLSMVGHRESQTGLEGTLGGRLALAAPLLLPLPGRNRADRSSALLLLPGAPFALTFDRVRTDAPSTERHAPLALWCGGGCRMQPVGNPPGKSGVEHSFPDISPATPLLIWRKGRVTALALPPVKKGDVVTIRSDGPRRSLHLFWQRNDGKDSHRSNGQLED